MPATSFRATVYAVFSSPAPANLVEGDYIGTDYTGTSPLANAQCGVYFDNSNSGNLVGGATAAARNVISANGVDGVEIYGSGTTATWSRATTSAPTTPAPRPLGNGPSAWSSTMAVPSAIRSAGRPPEPATSSRPTGSRRPDHRRRQRRQHRRRRRSSAPMPRARSPWETSLTACTSQTARTAT